MLRLGHCFEVAHAGDEVAQERLALWPTELCGRGVRWGSGRGSGRGGGASAGSRAFEAAPLVRRPPWEAGLEAVREEAPEVGPGEREAGALPDFDPRLVRIAAESESEGHLSLAPGSEVLVVGVDVVFGGGGKGGASALAGIGCCVGAVSLG